MRRRRRRHRRNPSGFWAWASDHWFLTFLLLSSAIALPASMIAAARPPRPLPAPPPVPGGP